MPYPVAHGLLGAAVVAALGEQAPPKRRAAQIAVGAFIGILPDFDYGLHAFIKGPYGWHHYFTHSFAFAAAVGVLTALVMGRPSARTMLAFSLATASHPVLDYFFTEGRGIALFWPFTDFRYRYGSEGTVYHALRSGQSGGRLRVRLVIASLIEAAVFLPMLGAALWWRRRRAAVPEQEEAT